MKISSGLYRYIDMFCIFTSFQSCFLLNSNQLVSDVLFFFFSAPVYVNLGIRRLTNVNLD